MKRLILLLFTLSSCAHNPVTGKKEFTIISENQETQIGKGNYNTMVQAQGGPFTADPELVAYVQSVGKKLAEGSHRPHLDFEFVIINDSIPNAWALPGGKIAINRGLLTELTSEAELAAVLSHEITHAVARHGAKGIERGLFLQGGVIALSLALQNKTYSDVLINGAQLGAILIQQKYSRDHELEADSVGIAYMNKAGYAPDAAVQLQETFLRLSKDKKSIWIDALFASHPPSQERIDANKKTISLLPERSNFYGKEVYEEKTALLKKQQNAYKENEQAQACIKENKIIAAKMHIDKALGQFPSEGIFWQTLGDIYARQQLLPQAQEAYGNAIARCDQNWYPYLARARIYANAGQFTEAKKDAQKSIDRLATGEGHEFLGQLFLQTSDRRKAQYHFEIASNANSEAGLRAREALYNLMPQKNSVELEAYIDGKNAIVCSVCNRSKKTIKKITIEIVENPHTSFQRRYKISIPRTISAFQSHTFKIVLKSKIKTVPKVSLILVE